MAKKVGHVSDLPSWFDLTKYSGAASLDAAGWYEQLTVRKWQMEIMNWRDEGQKPRFKSELELFDFVREMPIVDVTANLAMKVWFYDEAMHEHRTGKPNYSLGVRLSTVRDFYLTEGHIEPEKREYAHGFFAQIFDEQAKWLDGTNKLQFPCTDWIDAPVDAISNKSGYALTVHVDLALPDRVLIEQFRALLQSRRRPLSLCGIDLAPNRRVSPADWITFGVLPFLDLKIWERQTRVKIPNRVMADAIFPVGEGGEEVVRKTTSKIAKVLMADGNLKFLAAVAGQQIAEANCG